MPLQVAEVLGLGAESPGQDLCETRHGALQPQQLRELIQRQLAPYCDCLWNRPGQIVVPMRYGHILQACTKEVTSPPQSITKAECEEEKSHVAAVSLQCHITPHDLADQSDAVSWMQLAKSGKVLCHHMQMPHQRCMSRRVQMRTDHTSMTSQS